MATILSKIIDFFKSDGFSSFCKAVSKVIDFLMAKRQDKKDQEVKKEKLEKEIDNVANTGTLDDLLDIAEKTKKVNNS